MPHTNHFLFVVSKLDYGTHTIMPERIFEGLTGRSTWLIGRHAPHYKIMSAGDTVVFYFSGAIRRYFVADAVMAGSPRPMTPDERSYATQMDLLDFPLVIPLKQLHRWHKPIPIASLYDGLGFIKNRQYPGLYLRGGIVKLSGSDYRTIMSRRS